MNRLSVIVDGTTYTGEVDPWVLLVDYLRNQLDLTATTIGCDTGHCGSCTVDVDGASVKGCLILAIQVDGREVTTIQGLASRCGLHPLQRSFREQHALQCGYCTPGMVMASRDLLRRNPDPSPQEIRQGLKGNLCRCTGYQNIVKAVIDAALEMQADTSARDEKR